MTVLIAFFCLSAGTTLGWVLRALVGGYDQSDEIEAAFKRGVAEGRRDERHDRIVAQAKLALGVTALLCVLQACAPGAAPNYTVTPDVQSEALSVCSPRSMLTSYVTSQWRRPSSDCYSVSFVDGNGGYACNLPLQWYPYALIEIPKQIASSTRIFGDVSECFLDGDQNTCWRWFRARCTCGSGCVAESLPENL